MVESFIAYMRACNFVAPEIEKRYFRLFGDLEYDLLALRIETSVMALRLREVRRRVMTCIWISTEEERQISVTSHELNEHLYTRLERLHARITTARSFKYNHASEGQGYILLRDIAMAVLGIGDAAARKRERSKLDDACGAYARLDIPALIELHDSVQDLLALQRRDALDEEETTDWEKRLDEIAGRHPLRFADILDAPELITVRTEMLKRKIAREQERLEISGMVYTAAIRAMRFRN
jgi:hypothetical protein